MTRVLTITGILPIAEIEKKRNENDVLLETECQLKKNYNNISFKYIFILPFTNFILAKLSSQWKSYYRLKIQKEYTLGGRSINILAIIILPKKLFFRHFLYRISFSLNRKYLDHIIKNYSPTVIHAQSIGVDAFIAKKLSIRYNIPYIVTLRGMKNEIDKWDLKNIDLAKHLIAISPVQQRKIVKYVDKDIHFIPHGVSNRFFVPGQKDKVTLPLKFVSVCRLLKLKNLDRVVYALSEIKEDYLFHIYGDGPEKENLEYLINDLHLEDKIILKGFIKNEKLSNILADYDVFVMPSKPETFGRVYLESMASGVPVIAAKGTGIDGLITHGKEGFIIEPSVEELKRVFYFVIGKYTVLDSMRDNAYQFSLNFKWDSVVKKIFKLYVP